MSIELIKEILEIVKRKNKIDQTRDWSNGSSTFFEEIKLELGEVETELKSGKRVYLEEELGDVLWDYLNLLKNLENEKKISLDNVFKRCLKKYGQRVSGIDNGVLWEDIKNSQKKELKEEQDLLDEK